MHILVFSDQHPESSGGAQVSIRLQRRFLEAAGHTVTVCSPRMHQEHDDDPHYLDTPSIPITLDREYSMTVPGRLTDRWLDARLAELPPVDVVHVQADFWQALTAYRYAERHGIPALHTMHNRMDVGIEQTMPAPGLVVGALSWWQRRVLRPRLSTLPTGVWSYLQEFAKRAAVVIAPSHHFARVLREQGVTAHAEVLSTGVDDAVLDEILDERATTLHVPHRLPSFVWIGRFSQEKRLMEFLEAVRLADVDAVFRLYGAGLLLAKAQAFVAQHDLADHVVFAGRVSYPDSLRAIADADALVQTSIGFETQGMTVFEAAALGTPSIISDPNIAAELPADSMWQPTDGGVEALAEAIRRAVADIEAGTAPVVAPGLARTLRQSTQTTRLISLYEAALPPETAR
ncbi:glycosyltransferase [Plantibacter sp. PA-3-X8]|uniref:glycosyltransferase n=1 Tax=Plantibacter sp. PA-3-X8 TaxID=2480625 RepID=UPI000F5FC51A|nr:glycosyltransferase [Plantibacter sp. PA-3-X8]AZH84917.1 glycosyltransferase [Plantibacter sp. PA-3-X8]